MGYIQPSGSEVMGLMGSGLPARTKRRLSENPICPTVFVTAFFVFTILYHVPGKKSTMSTRKSQMFLHQRIAPMSSGFVQGAKKAKKSLTKQTVYGKMTSVHIIKTVMEILLLSEAPESRRSVRAGADGSSGLVPESALPKHG